LTEENGQTECAPRKNRKALVVLGVTLIIVSSIRYYLPFHIYFLDISMKHKIFFSGLTIGVAELLFWFGLFLVGEEFVKKHWDRLSPAKWFRKKK